MAFSMSSAESPFTNGRKVRENTESEKAQEVSMCQPPEKDAEDEGDDVGDVDVELQHGISWVGVRFSAAVDHSALPAPSQRGLP
jgi:hypothetical protein